MADNVNVSQGIGTVMATNLIAGVHYPRTKMVFGDPGFATDVSVTNPMPVSGTLVVSGPVTVTGTVAVSNFPSSQTVNGTVAVSNFPATQAVTQSTSPWVVSGTVTANAGTGTFLVDGSAHTQPVSGTVAVSSVGGTVTVTGTVAVSGTVTVSGTVAVSSVGGTVTVAGIVTANAGTGTFLVDGSAHTQPVSGTVAVSSVAGTVTVSGTVTVTGVATATNQTNGGQKTQVVDGANATVGPVTTLSGVNYFPVISTSSSTPGSAIPARATLVAGSDGTNARSLSTDTSGNVNVNTNLALGGASNVAGALTVGTSAVQAKVGGSVLTNRRLLTVNNTSAVTLYWGWANTVTTSSGTAIQPGQIASWALVPGGSTAVWLIAGTASNDSRITEGL